MQSLNQESATSGPINLLKHYSFETQGKSYEKVLDSWLARFPLSWVNLALIESLHQGRYKVVSVEQILTLWQRRGKPSYHFNHDFERLVSNRLPQTLASSRSSQNRDQQQSHFQSRRRSFSHSDRRNRFFPIDSAVSNPIVDSISDSSNSSFSQDNPPSNSNPAFSQTKPFWENLDQENIVNPNVAKLQDHSVEKSQEPVVTADKMEMEAQPDSVIAAPSGEVAELGIVSEHSKEEDSKLKISVPDSSKGGGNFNPIDQFVPQSGASVFLEKLTAMAQINV